MGPLHAEYEPTYDERVEQRSDLAEHCYRQDSWTHEHETYRSTRWTLDSRPTVDSPSSMVDRLSSASR